LKELKIEGLWSAILSSRDRRRCRCGRRSCKSIFRSLVMTRYRFKHRWDRDSGFSPY